MTRHQYYRGDTRISETEALDPSTGHLKDGVAVRVRSIMRDSDGRVLFTDGTPDGGGNRPGWRIPLNDDAKRRAVVRDAYQRYETELTNRWRCRDGQHLCSACLGSGLDEDNEACGSCGGSGVIGEFNSNALVENTAADRQHDDGLSLADRMKDHQRNMSKLYAATDAELSQAWRGK